MTLPQIYILIEGGVVQAVRTTHGLKCELVVFDIDSRDSDRIDENETDEQAEKRLFGMTWDDAYEHSECV